MLQARAETRIALMTGREAGYPSQVALGCMQYIRPQHRWQVAHYAPDAATIRQLRGWRPDGVVAYITDENERVLAELGVPLVNVSGGTTASRYPRVRPDDDQIGRLAAEHFLQRGFHHFGFLGHLRHAGSKRRCAGFDAALAEHGHTGTSCEASPSAQGGSYARFESTVVRWLESLPTPVGAFCFSDGMARIAVDLCTQLGLRVPEQVAILGCDDNPVVCQMAWPPLSSVRTPAQRIGYEAAQLLSQLLDGQPAPADDRCIEADGITVRQSTDILAIRDEQIAAALRIVRDRAHEGINVKDVLARVPISRTWLETQFKAILGRTPLEEIRRVRMEHAKRLLTDTTQPMPWIARRSGFSSPIRFSTVFKQLTGQTPTQFRRDAQRMRSSTVKL